MKKLILFSCNIRITSTGQLTIRGNIELMGNSHVIVEPGGALIIDGCTLSNVDLDIKSGAYFQIINNGVVETAVSNNNNYGNNTLFNLFGIQMTRQPERGIYIQNGKKFISK